MLGGESFAVMRTLLIAAMGEPLTPAEMDIFTRLTGRAEVSGSAAEELWIIAGRRSGKTRAIGTLAAYLAGCCDYRATLGPGERGVLPIMAASTLQAGQCYNFIRGIFTNIPRFAALVEQLGGRHGGITTDTISLKNRIDIQVRPASYRTIRGITAIAAIAEECSMWQSDESRNPDKEILAAVRPAMAP
jgi:phage terminase large subunit-like protein